MGISKAKSKRRALAGSRPRVELEIQMVGMLLLSRVRFIQALRTPAGSHERIAVIELFGRHSGETALIAGYLAGADRTLISEVPVDIDRLAKLGHRDPRV